MKLNKKSTIRQIVEYVSQLETFYTDKVNKLTESKKKIEFKMKVERGKLA